MNVYTLYPVFLGMDNGDIIIIIIIIIINNNNNNNNTNKAYVNQEMTKY